MFNQTSITVLDVFSVSGAFWPCAFILFLFVAITLESLYKIILANETSIRKMIFNLKFQVLSRLYALEWMILSLLNSLEQAADRFYRNRKVREVNSPGTKRIKL